jgi:hypothetical protein
MEGQGQFFPYDGPTPPYEASRKPRGCVFYGCIISIVIAVLLALLIGFLIYTAYRLATKFINEYGEDVPAPIPVAVLPADKLEDLKSRVTRFQESLQNAAATEPLVLTADEINALIDSIPFYKGVIAVDLDGDKIRGKVSFPCERIGIRGKYLNGTATFKVKVDDGRLEVRVDSAEVKGKPISEEDLAKLREENLAKDTNTDPEKAHVIRRIDRIEVKDGKLIIYPKPLPEPKEGAVPAEKKADDKPAEKKPPEKPAPTEAEKPAPK